MRSWRLVAALIVVRDCPFDRSRELTREEQAGIYLDLFKSGDEYIGGHGGGRRSRDRQREGDLTQFCFFIFRWIVSEFFSGAADRVRRKIQGPLR